MPQKDDSINHRMRMMNPGDEMIVPAKDYLKVRCTAHYIKKDWNVVIRYHIFEDADCVRKVRVWFPTDADNERMKEARLASIIKCRSSMTRSLKQLKKLCEEWEENVSDWLPEGLEYTNNNGKEERD